jgi:hypothetical protein
MILNAKLPEWFWTFAIQAAVHLKNRVSYSALPKQTTLFEFWFHYKPNLSHLRLFGAHCTARITPMPGTKLCPRGEHGRHLGYAKDARNYIVWIPGTDGRGGTVKVRRDVKIHNHLLPEGVGPRLSGDHENDTGIPEESAHTHEVCVKNPTCAWKIPKTWVSRLSDDHENDAGIPKRPLHTHEACVKLTHAWDYI